MAKIMHGKTGTKEVATKAYPILEVKSKNLRYKKSWLVIMAFTMSVGIVSASANSYAMALKTDTININQGEQFKPTMMTQLKTLTMLDALVNKQVPTEYSSALRKAQSYNDIMHMSKARLYHQLTSEYGEKFSPAAAQYAVDNVNANWKENALKTAQSYQEHMAMSPRAIYDQLISEYGEQFTSEEAQYAIDHLN